MEILTTKIKVNPFYQRNGLPKEAVEQLMKDGSASAKWYQQIIIYNMRWIDMTLKCGVNCPFDSQRLDSRKRVVNQEIRTLSRNGIQWYEAQYMGSKANNVCKLQSVQKKLSQLKDNGEFVFYNITEWSWKNRFIPVHILSVKDWKYCFGKNTFQSTFTEMQKLIKDFCVPIEKTKLLTV